MSLIGERIQHRRQEIGMSQDELAERLGYKNRSAISRIEQGHNAFSIDKVEDFARVLQTTVADLMGWDDESKKLLDVIEFQISQEDKNLKNELIESYNKLNTLGKQEANKRVNELTQLPLYTKGE